MNRLQGKVAVITGAASGIGAASAMAMAAEGAKVALTDIDDVKGQAVAASIAAAGGTAIYLHHDVVDEAGWDAVMDETRTRLGELSVLVNNAGVALEGGVSDLSYERWRRQIQVNLDSVFLGTRAAVRAMKASKGGSIINMSSVAGLKASPGLSAYSASKGGVRLFSKSVAIECAMMGLDIRVNSVHPGVIETEIWEKDMAVLYKRIERGQTPADPLVVGDRVNASALARRVVPGGRLGLPQDVAAGVVFLASDEARYLNGTELVIDGGLVAA